MLFRIAAEGRARIESGCAYCVECCNVSVGPVSKAWRIAGCSDALHQMMGCFAGTEFDI